MNFLISLQPSILHPSCRRVCGGGRLTTATCMNGTLVAPLNLAFLDLLILGLEWDVVLF